MQIDEAIKGQDQFERLVSHCFIGQSGKFDRWRRDQGFSTTRYNQRTVSRSRSRTFNVGSDLVNRYGFSYGRGLFYQIDALQMSIHQMVVVSEREIAHRRKWRGGPGELALRTISVESSMQSKSSLPTPTIDWAVWEHYAHTYDNIGMPAWDLPPTDEMRMAYAFRPDGSISTVLGEDPEPIVCGPIPEQVPRDRLERAFGAANVLLKLALDV